MTHIDNIVETDGALILGAGIAGLFTALKLAPMPSIVLAGTRPGLSGSSAWAQGGIAAALILGLGRAIGEAIAVTQVIGDVVGIHANLFFGGDTLASKIAESYQGSSTDLQTASLVYLGLILLVFSLLVNLTAQWIVRRSARAHGITRGGHA